MMEKVVQSHRDSPLLSGMFYVLSFTTTSKILLKGYHHIWDIWDELTSLIKNEILLFNILPYLLDRKTFGYWVIGSRTGTKMKNMSLHWFSLLRRKKCLWKLITVFFLKGDRYPYYLKWKVNWWISFSSVYNYLYNFHLIFQ